MDRNDTSEGAWTVIVGSSTESLDALGQLLLQQQATARHNAIPAAGRYC
jgi:hypothetical protein